jgi:hypothetical protein
MDLFDLKVSKGTINAILTRPPALLEAEIEQLRARAKAETGALGADETGYHVQHFGELGLCFLVFFSNLV